MQRLAGSDPRERTHVGVAKSGWRSVTGTRRQEGSCSDRGPGATFTDPQPLSPCASRLQIAHPAPCPPLGSRSVAALVVLMPELPLAPQSGTGERRPRSVPRSGATGLLAILDPRPGTVGDMTDPGHQTHRL